MCFLCCLNSKPFFNTVVSIFEILSNPKQAQEASDGYILWLLSFIGDTIIKY